MEIPPAITTTFIFFFFGYINLETLIIKVYL